MLQGSLSRSPSTLPTEQGVNENDELNNPLCDVSQNATCSARGLAGFHEKALISQERRRGAAHLWFLQLVPTLLPFALLVSSFELGAC